jgi:hypothetical protein
MKCHDSLVRKLYTFVEFSTIECGSFVLTKVILSCPQCVTVDCFYPIHRSVVTYWNNSQGIVDRYNTVLCWGYLLICSTLVLLFAVLIATVKY